MCWTRGNVLGFPFGKEVREDTGLNSGAEDQSKLEGLNWILGRFANLGDATGSGGGKPRHRRAAVRKRAMNTGNREKRRAAMAKRKRGTRVIVHG